MGNLSDPVASVILMSVLMGLLGGLMTLPISAIAFWMLKNHEQENQRKLELFAKKQELLLRHRLEFQRQNRTSRRIKASIAELKAGQKKQAGDISSIITANDKNVAAIKKSLTTLDQNTTSLGHKLPQLDERLLQLQMEQRKAAETISNASIAQIETRLAALENLHDGLKQDS
jgi:hypothetical protein